MRYAPALAPVLTPAFAHLEAEGAVPDVVLESVRRGEQIGLLRNGDWLLSCSGDEAATVLKGQVQEEVLARAHYVLAMHAATLTRNGRMMLVSGHPGAGKTTLALALVNAGFGFAGDDLALLHAEGEVSGVPFAPAVKTGAWKLVADCRPDIADLPTFRRLDHQRVRYLPPPRSFPTGRRPVGAVVLLDRRANAPADLARVDPFAAMRRLLKESYTRNRQLAPSGFTALGRMVDGAACYRLTYSKLTDAAELLHRACL